MKQKKTGTIDLSGNNLTKNLILFALPIALSSILQQLFNSADVAVAGRFAGNAALAAVGANAPIINMFIHFCSGIGIGANATLSFYLGKSEKEKLNRIVRTAITVGIIIGLLLVPLILFCSESLLTVTKTPQSVFEEALLYLRIFCFGLPFLMLYNVGAALMRGYGDSRRPLYCLIFSGCLNLILNVIFVIAFGMGVAGVAVATLIANILSSGLVLLLLMKHKDKDLRLNLRKLKIEKEYLKQILKIGLPSAVQGLFFSFSNICIQSAINSLGENVVAGSAAALNFEGFCFYIVSAFSQTAVTFTGRNFGAGNYEQCKRIFRRCILIGFFASEMLALVFVLGRKFFLGLYTTDNVIIQYAMVRLLTVCVLEGLTATYDITGGCLRGIGHSALPAAFTVFGTCFVRVLWIFTVFRKYNDFRSLLTVYPITWTLTGAAVLVSYFIIRKKEFSKSAS